MIPLKASFLHQGCIYGSDAEFLAMAVPFVQDGVRSREPVLVATTQANIELLQDVVGPDADGVEYADPDSFGRRPPQRATALHRYWTRNRPTGTVRVLAEPSWTGRSGHEIAAVGRMEAALNVVLADTRIWMICPYDTRVVEREVIADVRRTHPECVVGCRAEPSAQFMLPEEFARSRGHAPGVAADLFRFEGDLVAVRRYVLNMATALLGSDEDGIGMFGIAAGEAITYLARQGIERAAVWVRSAAGRVVCTLHSDKPLDHVNPFVGYRPPDLATQPGDGLWLTNQICDWLDVSSDASGCTIELAMPVQAAEDLRRAEKSRQSFGRS